MYLAPVSQSVYDNIADLPNAICEALVKSVNMVLNVHRNHKAYLGRGEGDWGIEVGARGGGGERETCRYTVITRMIPALR